MDQDVDLYGRKDNSRSHDGLNVSIAAQSRSHITSPVFTNTNIRGNVQIIHNAAGMTGHHSNTQTERTQTSVRRSLLKYKEQIRNEYQYVTEYNSLPGEHVLLSDRYIQPVIIQKHRDQKEREEEISSRGETFQQVLDSRSAQESIALNTLFNPDSRGVTPGAVILQGNSGNGKSITVQKMMLDWASDLYRTKFEIVFHLKCKEISHISNRTSLVELLSYNCCLTSDQISTILQQSPERVLFLVDGFDELKNTEDIYRMPPPTDPNQKAPPEVTLCALLRGHILRESCLLVTTRSTAIDTLTNVLKEPHSFKEIIGFTEKAVEEYFKKFFQNDRLFRKGYEYVRANETLFTACSIPVICWIICTVIRERLSDDADVTSELETTTSIYVDFLCTLLDHHCQGLGQSVPTLVKSLGKLAEKGILAQQVLFDEKTVYEIVSDPTGSPFLCKFLFKKRIHQETLFSFMHLSFQEFFTALYYLLLDENESKKKVTQIFSIQTNPQIANHFPPHFAAVVHFIFGLLNGNTRRTLWKRHGLLVHSNMRDHLKKWIFEEKSHSYSERTLFFFHCLYELHEADFVKEVAEAWPSVYIDETVLRRTDCWVLLYCAQCCECIEELVFYLSLLTSEKLAIILPVLHKFRSVRFEHSGLSHSDFWGIMQIFTRGQTLKLQSLEINQWQYSAETGLHLKIDRELSSFEITRTPKAEDPVNKISLSFPRSELISLNWTNFFQILLQTDRDVLLFLLNYLAAQKLTLKLKSLTKAWVYSILTFTRDYPSLTEIRLEADWLLEEAVSVLQTSQPRSGCTLTFEGFRCKKSSNRCTDLYPAHWSEYQPAYFLVDLNCNQRVKIHLNKQGFSVEPLRNPLFWD